MQGAGVSGFELVRPATLVVTLRVFDLRGGEIVKRTHDSVFGDFDPDLGHRPEGEHDVLGLGYIAAIEFMGTVYVTECPATLLDA